MALLTYQYNPNQTVALLLQAIEVGERRKAQEQQVIAGMAKAVADDRRHALEFDRLQAFAGAKFAEENRRYNLDNAPFTIPSLPESAPVTSSTVGSPSPLTGPVGPDVSPTASIPSVPELTAPTEGVDLYTAGGPVPASRSLLTGEPVETEPVDGFTERIATKRASQLQTALDAIRSRPENVVFTPEAMGRLEEGLSQARVGAAREDATAMMQQTPPGMSLAQVAPVDPLKPTIPNVAPAPPPVNDGNIAGPLPTRSPDPAAWDEPASLTPAMQIRSTLGQLASLNQPGRPPVIRQKDVRAALPAILRSTIAANNRRSTSTPPETLEQVTAGMEFNPEHGTYKRGDGAEYFVGRSAGGRVTLQAFKPKEVKAARWVQGSDGKAYALGNDGKPMQPVPDGVDLQFAPSKPQTTRDNAGNVYLLQPGQTQPMLILPAKTKMSATESAKYTAALGDKQAAEAELAAKRPAFEKSWFGVGKKDIAEAEERVRTAEATIKATRERYPEIPGQTLPVKEPAPTEEPLKPGAENTYASADEVKAAVKAGTLTREEGLGILKSKFGFE